MSQSLKFESAEDPEKLIFVTADKNWTNIKVYANGKTQYSAPNGDALRNGVTNELEELGTLHLKLDKNMEVSVNGMPYIQNTTVETKGKVNSVAVIFWVLTAFSVLGLFMLAFVMSKYTVIGSELLLGAQVFAVLVYTATAILLQRGVYWFYFIGTCTFLFFTTLSLLDIERTLGSGALIIVLLIRLTFLVLILRLIPTILKSIRAKKPTNTDSILDQ